MDQADDAVEIALAERESRVAALAGDLEVLFDRARGRQMGHVGARHHHLTGIAQRELEDVVEDLALELGLAAHLRRGEQQAQLLFRMRQLLLAGRLEADQLQQAARRLVQQPDRRETGPVESRSGIAIHRAVGCGRRMANDFGACCWITMCSTVMQMKATVRLTECTSASVAPGILCTSGATIQLKAGSPTQPSARLARVMPKLTRREVGVEMGQLVARELRGLLGFPLGRAGRAGSGAL